MFARVDFMLASLNDIECGKASTQITLNVFSSFFKHRDSEDACNLRRHKHPASF